MKSKLLFIATIMTAFGLFAEEAAEKVVAEAIIPAGSPDAEALVPDDPGLYAVIETPKGKIVCELYYQKVPMTVASFVGLAEGTITNTVKKLGEPYFDGLNFHRVVPGFVIQGGCPYGTGRGNPGYSFPDEFDSTLKHSGPGILSMANSGPGTNGSQFFITLSATPHLDGKHSVFGRVVEGQNIVSSTERGDKIKSVKVFRVGDAAKAFKSDDAAFKALKEKAEQKAQQAALARKQAARERSEKQKKALEAQYPNALTTSSGMKYIIEMNGKGDTPKRGEIVSVHYTGTLANGTKFDSSLDRGTPIQFPVGMRRVIPGWDEGIMMMRKGGKRKLIIPPELAYGKRGIGPIPPESWLIFDVELIDIQPAQRPRP
jgi:peptidylprolyl isomerase